MGDVYLAQDTRLDRLVALKILPKEFATDADRMRRFVLEARAASALNHPNIITIYEIGETEETNFIATEYVEGKTLNDLWPFSLPAALDVAVQIASALQAAHSAGIVHRDIKPENAILRPDGLVKILDFGIAKLLGPAVKSGVLNSRTDPEAATAIRSGTSAGMIIGTASYMSPEQARGKEVDARTDIFSFGAMLYEMLTGQKPFAGETINHIFVNIMEKEPPPVSAFLKGCPAELDRIIQKTMAKNADQRYGTAKDLLANLKNLQKRLEFEAEFAHVSRPAAPAEAETRISEPSDGKAALLPPNNLTENLSPLVGREKEIAEITNLLRQNNVRLVTMTGIGGTGKTRLAQTVARRLLREFSDGVFFVNLAAITDSKLVVSTIAQTLGVKEAGGAPVLEVLKNHLGQKRMLLVVDNFEQVLAATTDIAELFVAADKLKILITSRELLHLKAENGYAVPPLAVPSKETRISFAELSNYEALRFFVERAQFAKPDFALTEDNADAVAEICRRLDGLPLAIELASARIKLFAPQAILARLSNSLKLLTGGARDLPERQQTMRGAIAWSYDLLNDDEKKLFARLAVFAGGFTLEGAESVVSSPLSVVEEDNAQLTIHIFDGIGSLLEKSLIAQREQADGEPRLRMQEVVREFALEKLATSGEAEQIKRLHAEFYALLPESLKAAEPARWPVILEQEHDNLRAALEWSLDNQPENALRIVGAMGIFWIQHGHLSEGNKWAKRALEKNGEDCDPKLRAKAYFGLGFRSRLQGNPEEAELFLEKNLHLAREISDQEQISSSLGGLAILKLDQNDLIQAKALCEESLAIARALNDKKLIGLRLTTLGNIARAEENYQAADEFLKEALTIEREESFEYLIPSATNNLASVACLQGDYNSALSYALESLKVCEEMEETISLGIALNIFAALAVAAGEMEKAGRFCGAAQAIFDAAAYKLENVDREFLDRYVRKAQAAIGDEAFAVAQAQGSALPIKEAIALARENEADLKFAVGSGAHITDGTHSGATRFQAAAHATEEPHAKGSSATVAHGVSSAEYITLEVKKHKLAWLGALAVFAVALAAIGYWTYFRSPPIKSIAVLPFVTSGDASDGELLSDGLSENLINTLSRLPQLKVIARSSSFKYRGENVDIQDAARKLGVDAILTGRVLRRGDDLEISVELINAADNTRIWGEIYNRKVSAQLDVPEEIAQAVSEKLQLKLSDVQERQMTKRVTNNAQAYQLYLNGVFYRRKNGAENIRKAIEYQNQAIALDATFALAYVELAINFGNLTEIGSLSPQEGTPRARAAAERGLALDETLADAHYNIARIKKSDFDWAGAESSFRRAIELNPNLAAAHTIYAEYLSQLGRFDEGLREIRRAQELDPLRGGLIGNEGDILYYARRYDEAVTKMQEGLKPEPENASARIFLGQAYAAAGQYENASREFQTAYQTDNQTTGALVQLGRTYALSGKRDEAAAILDQLKTTNRYVSPAALAIFYAALGDKEAAFKSLEQAYAERDLQLQFLKVEPGYDSLRADPRYKEMLKRLNLPE